MDVRQSVRIDGFDHYEVSDAGEVFNTITGKKLKGWKNQQRYHRVTLIKDGKRKDFYVHRIVALTFHDYPGDGYEVHHKDNDRSNNRKDNLEWLTRAENMAHVHAGWLNRKWAKKANSVPSTAVKDYSQDFTDPIDHGDDLPF